MITQSRLKELFHYNPDTGIFTTTTKRGKWKEGRVVGGVSKSHGYIVFRADKNLYLAHRMAWLYMNGSIPEFLDHKNRNRTDNRMSNIAESSKLDNAKNKTCSDVNTSGRIGVSFRASINKHRAYITVSGSQKHLGYFDTQEEAIAARLSAELLYGFTNNHQTKEIK